MKAFLALIREVAGEALSKEVLQKVVDAFLRAVPPNEGWSYKPPGGGGRSDTEAIARQLFARLQKAPSRAMIQVRSVSYRIGGMCDCHHPTDLNRFSPPFNVRPSRKGTCGSSSSAWRAAGPASSIAFSSPSPVLLSLGARVLMMG